MFSRNNSYSYLTSLKNAQNNPNNIEIYKSQNLKPDISNRNIDINHIEHNNRTHKYYHQNPEINTINYTFNRGRQSNFKKKTINDNYEDIKKIYEAIEDIKKNQKELIAVMKGMKFDKKVDDNTIQQNENNEIDNKNDENDFLTSFKELKEDLEKMKKEIFMLKKNDEENKKIIESNNKEIENLKKNLREKNKNNTEIEDEKDKEIKKLKESLKKSENEKINLNNQNFLKDNEIKNLKKQLEESNSKIYISQKLSDLNNNIELIKKSIAIPNSNQNTNPMENLKKSQSLDFEPNSNIIFKNSHYMIENKNA